MSDADGGFASDADERFGSDTGGRFALDARTYRWTDRLTKVAGVALVAVGLEVGGGSLVGVALGASGAALALSTVFVERPTDPTCDDTDE